MGLHLVLSTMVGADTLMVTEAILALRGCLSFKDDNSDTMYVWKGY